MENFGETGRKVTNDRMSVAKAIVKGIGLNIYEICIIIISMIKRSEGDNRLD